MDRSKQDEEARKGGDNEIEGSRQARQALKPRAPKREGKKSKRTTKR